MRYNKFSIGNKVRIPDGECQDKEYQVVAIVENSINDMFKNPGVCDFTTTLEYKYRLRCIEDGSIKYAEESGIESIPLTQKDINMQLMLETLNQAPMVPKFRVGDVVSINGAQDKTYVIQESVNYGASIGIGYEMLSIDNEDQIVNFLESDLSFIYHDVSWEYKLAKSEDDHDEAFLEMAGRLPRDKSGKCNLVIAVGANERNIAHFHVFRSEEDLRAWRNGACLYFEENRYYDHSNNAETLTRDELKIVVDILKSTHKDLGITNWRYLIALWNDNNDRYQIDTNTSMPDYDYKTITRYKEKN